MKKQNKKGFTLAELLIVLAIIAILVAIMFPVFGAQLNKARGMADLANVRAKYSELIADKMLAQAGQTEFSIEVKESELNAARQYPDKTSIALTQPIRTGDGAPKNGKVTVSYDGVVVGSFETDTDVTLTDD